MSRVTLTRLVCKVRVTVQCELTEVLGGLLWPGPPGRVPFKEYLADPSRPGPLEAPHLVLGEAGSEHELVTGLHHSDGESDDDVVSQSVSRGGAHPHLAQLDILTSQKRI